METPKMSEMVADFARDFLALGNTAPVRLNLLRCACSAWNIACAPESARPGLLDEFMVHYRELNPDETPEAYRGARRDMELLIGEKLRKYPQALSQIVSCDLNVLNGTDCIVVSSIRR